MEKYGRKVYEDRFVEPKKNKLTSYAREASSSSTSLLYANVKAYFDDWFAKILAKNQVCEDQIMGRIEVVAKEVKEGRKKIREEM